MADVVDKTTRSRMMSGIRAKDTRPEIFIRRGLHRLGFRFRLHAKDIPGKPDVVLPKYRSIIIVHGCFWHGHGCRYCRTPKTNTAFWQEKIRSNQARDERNLLLQKGLGWRCLIVWECAVRRSLREPASLDVVALCAGWLVAGGGFGCIDEDGLARMDCP